VRRCHTGEKLRAITYRQRVHATGDIGTVGVSRVAGWTVLVCGCNVAWGIRQIPEPDAAVPQLCDNITAHDEDGDTVRDGCDRCPGIPDPAQHDTDGDGVGDACDPSSMTKNRIAWFESFAEPGGAQWTVTKGSWAFQQDAAIYTDLTSTSYAVITAMTRPDPPYTVEVGFTIDNIALQGSLLDVFGDTDVQCGPIRHSPTSGDFVRVEDNVSNANSEQPVPTLHPGQRLRVTMTYDPTSKVRCGVTDRDTGTTTVTDLPLAGVPVTSFGIRDLGLPVHVEYVAVYAPAP